MKNIIEANIAWLTKAKKLTFKKELLDLTDLGDNEICCETLASTISPGTEIAAYSGMSSLRPGPVYPRLLGYCNISLVKYCGKNVSNIKVGDRIFTLASHRSHFFISENEVIAKIPKNLESRYAASVYLYHLGYTALIKANVKYGMPIVIIGLGAIGLATVAVAVNSGAKVYAISDHSEATNIAVKMGAKKVYTRKAIDLLINDLGSRLADVVISTSSSWEDWLSALKLAGINGNLSILGFPGRNCHIPPFNPLDSQYFYDKQLTIHAAGRLANELDKRNFLKFNEKDNINFLLTQMEDKKLNQEYIISDEFPWYKLEDAYNALISRQKSPVTYSIKW